MWPRCPPQRRQWTSTRSMPCDESRSISTARGPSGLEKLGQPVPESNLSPAPNSSAPHPAHRYVPGSCAFQYAPVKGRSVPLWRSTRYCSGASSRRHCSSVLTTLSGLSVMMASLTPQRAGGPLLLEDRILVHRRPTARSVAKRKVPMHLQTDRLALRRFTADDLDLLDRLNSDPEVTRYMGGTKDRAGSKAMLETRILAYYG